jgi:putative spermidine/putrescine transport system permease protein
MVFRRNFLVLWTAPAAACLLVFFAVPVLVMLVNSVHGGPPDGEKVWTLDYYTRLFTREIYGRVFFTTLRVAVITTLVAVVLGYPIAWAIARSRPMTARILTVIVIAPLFVNIVIRTFGWRIVLGRNGVINWALMNAGIISEPLDMLYGEGAVVVGSVHVFLPMMVLPLAAAIGNLNPALEEASRMLGASRFEYLRRVVLPLTLPGLGAGATLVFSLTAGSFVLPAILGGERAKMLGTLVEEQMLVISDWSFGSAIAVVLVALNLAAAALFTGLGERKARRYAAPAQ